MSKLSIIVPVYWNSDTLMLLYQDMKEKILHKLEAYEIVFVDDGSGDNSWEIMNQIRDIDENVRLVKLSRNFGEHAAILAGLSVCTGDCAVTKQADLQEDSELILQLYDKWKEGNKVVLAVRADRDEGAVQKFFANLYYTMMRKLVIKDISLHMRYHGVSSRVFSKCIYDISRHSCSSSIGVSQQSLQRTLGLGQL